jgi:hypothetical protein
MKNELKPIEQISKWTKHCRAVDAVYREANLDFRPEVLKILYRLHDQIDKQTVIITELTNPKQTRSEYMQKNWIWIGGILTIVGSMLTVYKLFL